MLDMIDRLLEHELNLSAEESSFVAFIICSVSSCPALLLQYVPRNFYKVIGLYRASDITLRTTANEDHGLSPQVMAGALLGVSESWHAHSGLEDVLGGQHDQGR